MANVQMSGIYRGAIYDYVSEVTHKPGNTLAIRKVYSNILAARMGQPVAFQAMQDAYNALPDYLKPAQTGIVNSYIASLRQATQQFTPWQPAMRSMNYQANPYAAQDRDETFLALKMSSPASATNANSAYNPGLQQFEDLFGNSIVSGQQFTVANRFVTPGIKCLKGAHAEKFTGLQA